MALKEALGRDPSMEEQAEDAGMGLRQFEGRWRQGLQAKQMMVHANLRLVVSICKKFRGSGQAMGLQARGFSPSQS